jgi:pimeloyl-ACP methyl ester carboxylesterase
MPDFSRIAHHDRPRYFVHDPSVIAPHWPSDPDPAFVAARAREAQTVGRLLGDAADFVHSLDRIRSPTLIAWGSEDRMLPAGNAPAWQAAIAGSTVRIFERAGHLLLDESAAARAAVAQFLSESTPQNNAA